MKNRALPERFGHKRHNSLVTGLEPNPKDNTQNMYLLKQLDWMAEATTEGMGVKNRILVALEDEEHASEMIQTISDRKNNVVQTWKRFTKMRSSDDHTQRRIENSSWRLWFKQRIELQRKKELQKMEEEMELQELETGVEAVHSAILSLFSSRSPSANDLRRVHSTGSLIGDSLEKIPSN